MEIFDWSDIAYNFLIGGDGTIYEGRGWNKQGAHEKGLNKHSLGIGILGTFQQVDPLYKQMHATGRLIEEGIRLGKINPCYDLFGQNRMLGDTEGFRTELM